MIYVAANYIERERDVRMSSWSKSMRFGERTRMNN